MDSCTTDSGSERQMGHLEAAAAGVLLPTLGAAVGPLLRSGHRRGKRRGEAQGNRRVQLVAVRQPAHLSTVRAVLPPVRGEVEALPGLPYVGRRPLCRHRPLTATDANAVVDVIQSWQGLGLVVVHGLLFLLWRKRLRGVHVVHVHGFWVLEPQGLFRFQGGFFMDFSDNEVLTQQREGRLGGGWAWVGKGGPTSRCA